METLPHKYQPQVKIAFIPDDIAQFQQETEEACVCVHFV